MRVMGEVRDMGEVYPYSRSQRNSTNRLSGIFRRRVVVEAA